MAAGKTSPPAPGSLETLLARIAAGGSPLYAAALEAAGGAKPSSLAKLALTRHADLVADQLQHPPLGSRRAADAPAPVRAGRSGSGDSLLVLTWTEADLAYERAAGVRILRAAGIAPGQRVANNLAGALVTPGSLLLGDVVDELGALDVPLGATESDAAAKQAWELIDRVQTQALVLDPATAERLFNAAPEQSRPWLELIVWLRTETSPAPPAVPAKLGFHGAQRSWLGVAEARSFVAVTCSAGSFHVDADLHAELVAAAGGVTLAAGKAGSLVLTPLSGETALLRYATDFRGRALPGACACGVPGVCFELEA